jgi:extracellular factor (EF) 3-hydroxypalmitic acid methyl ester biosynthesis protein
MRSAFQRAHALTPSTDMDFWKEALEHLDAGRGETGTRLIGDAFLRMRRSLPHDAWRSFASSLVGSAQHAILHQDPLTGRAYRKPRGYAGDAVMLDMMYGSAAIPEDTSVVGSTVFSYTSVSPASQSVTARRDFLADYVDTAAREYSKPDVLCVACGHLREGQRCRSLASGRLGKFVALDQDARSLRVVGAEQKHFGVEPLLSSVRGILNGTLSHERFDVIYTAGLYDYLETPVATALTTTLFGLLKPGGRLLIANFAPDLIDIGYMEAAMDWWLIYRSEGEMQDLIARVPTDELASSRVWRDGLGNIVYLEARRG